MTRQTAAEFVTDIVTDAAAKPGVKVDRKHVLQGGKSLYRVGLRSEETGLGVIVSYRVERKTGKSALVGCTVVARDGETVGTWSTWKAVRRHALQAVGA